MMDIKERLTKLANGVLVTEDVYRIAQKVKEYDDTLIIKYMSGNDLSDAPYALFEKCEDGMERKVFDIWNLDNSVLDKIYKADTQKVDVLTAMDLSNAKIRKNKLRRYEASMEEAKDVIASIFSSNKGRYTFKNQAGQTVQVDDSTRGFNGIISQERKVY